MNNKMSNFYVLDAIMDKDKDTETQYVILSCIDMEGNKVALRCNFYNYLYLELMKINVNDVENIINHFR